MSYDYETIQVNHQDHIVEVILNRMDCGNSFNPKMFEEIGSIFSHLETCNKTRAVILRGAGKSFSYGLDLKQSMSMLKPLLQGGLAQPRNELRLLIEKWQNAISAPARLKIPVIAAIHGWCIGAGLDLISACDLRFCSQDALFSLREARMGIVADLGSLQRLPKIIGDAATRELALTAKDIDAQRAMQLGLVSAVLDSPDELWQRAHEEAKCIAANPPLTIQGVKHILNFQDGKSIGDSLQYTATWNSAFLQSEDFAEAIAAFIEKRSPQYKGK
ncbi:crotonase/enoyl-CoA hydratase family protein [Candidatus Uabimicrobium amorphum]|uniref:Enoyl-CoA hydratase n=1 Tax=Uabimicrobium amorphum TaxID=2596890 RepID=A0A5S9IMG9_UABAM|nr:crotonase/enoyl-CoA hydratase family protein [Candidatus Uabimicrobium amorphum]BBM84250.1 enoyl-CoA hydratase [Candidatus Uabimicrobium amorphum]